MTVRGEQERESEREERNRDTERSMRIALISFARNDGQFQSIMIIFETSSDLN